jgi:hypothetical protein
MSKSDLKPFWGYLEGARIAFDQAGIAAQLLAQAARRARPAFQVGIGRRVAASSRRTLGFRDAKRGARVFRLFSTAA